MQRLMVLIENKLKDCQNGVFEFLNNVLLKLLSLLFVILSSLTTRFIRYIIIFNPGESVGVSKNYTKIYYFLLLISSLLLALVIVGGGMHECDDHVGNIANVLANIILYEYIQTNGLSVCLYVNLSVSLSPLSKLQSACE